MKVNPLLMDMIRGEWLMSFSGLSVYAPLVYKILSGETVTITNNTHRLMNVFDANGQMVRPDEKGIFSSIPKNSVAVINMIGPAIKYGDWCSYGADEIVSALISANNNENIRAIFLNIDGPGGSTSAIGPFLSFIPQKRKPVIGLVDQCCSLHFWVLCAVCDYKLAMNDVSPVIGSVGVVATFVDNKEYLEKLGYKIHEIYPKESEHKNQAFRLALEGKYDEIKDEFLSPMAKKFQAAVRLGCPNLIEEVGVLTGKVFDASIAKKYGMIDAIGGFDLATKMIPVIQEMKYQK
jgi:protease-4